jgi:hypothetical protein
MGVGRIGRTKVRPGFLESGADAYRRLEIPNREADGRQRSGTKRSACILVAIIAVGHVIGWMRAFFFGP